MRSEVVEPAPVTYEPAAQSVHAVQDDCPGANAKEPERQVVHEVAFGVAEYEPGAQVAQVRSLVGEPALTTTWPGLHAVHAVQDVAPAEDQVPSAQGVHAVRPVPSAENVPAGQAPHV